MANICSNEISFTATPDALNWLNGELDRLYQIEDYESRCTEIFNIFAGDDGYGNGDKTLGSKYAYIYRHDMYGDRLDMSVESAWHCPQVMFETITILLQEKSGDFPVVSEGRYWEEGVGFAGIFICDKDGFRRAETDLDTDYDEDDEDFDFYQDVLDPALADLTID